jgi:hypothetical protein
VASFLLGGRWVNWSMERKLSWQWFYCDSISMLISL